MSKKKLTVIACILIFALTGCKTADIKTNQEIVEKCYNQYLVSTNSSNLHIAAMLKTYSASVNHSPPYNWSLAIEQQKEYIKNASTHQISTNYNRIATDEEARIVDAFLGDVIIAHKNSQPRLFGFVISDMAAALIFKLNDYEYDQNDDK